MLMKKRKQTKKTAKKHKTPEITSRISPFFLQNRITHQKKVKHPLQCITQAKVLLQNSAEARKWIRLRTFAQKGTNYHCPFKRHAYL